MRLGVPVLVGNGNGRERQLSLFEGPGENEIEPPENLKKPMRASEEEREYHIARCKKTIRDVLNEANASIIVIDGVFK